MRSIPYLFVGTRILSDDHLEASGGFSFSSHFAVAFMGHDAFSGFCTIPVFSSRAPLCSSPFFLFQSSSVLVLAVRSITGGLASSSLLISSSDVNRGFTFFVSSFSQFYFQFFLILKSSRLSLFSSSSCRAHWCFGNFLFVLSLRRPGLALHRF